MTDDPDAAVPLRALPSADRLALPAPADAEAPEPRSHRHRAVLLAVVVLLAGALGFGKGVFDLRADAHHRLSQAIEAVHEADADLAKADRAAKPGLTAEGGDTARGANGSLRLATGRLRKALELVEDAEPAAQGSDVQLARALRQSVEGRLDMLDSLAVLLPLQARCSDALKDAEAGWASLQRASALSDQAAEAFNTHSRSGVASSTAFTERARSELASADAAVQRAVRSVPEAKLRPLLDLVADRVRAAEGSTRVDLVWLSGDVAEANALLANLVAEQMRAAARRAPLPRAVADPVREAYERLSAKAGADYAKARRLAEEGDARVDALLAQPSE